LRSYCNMRGIAKIVTGVCSLLMSSLFVSAVDIPLSEDSFKATMNSIWKTQMDGDAEAFLSFFDPNVQTFVNGEVDPSPWGSLPFVKLVFSKVQYSSFFSLINNGILDSNTAIAVYKWTALIKGTGEVIDMDPWHTKYTFNDAGKIVKTETIVNSISLVNFASALSSKSVTPLLEKFIGGLNTKNVIQTMSSVHKDFQFSRNGQQVFLNFGDSAFLEKMFSRAEKFNLQMKDLVDSKSSVGSCNIDAEIILKDGSTSNFQWAIAFEADEDNVSILRIHSIADGEAFDAVFKKLVE